MSCGPVQTLQLLDRLRQFTRAGIFERVQYPEIPASRIPDQTDFMLTTEQNPDDGGGNSRANIGCT
jgi:DNA-binding HxlR family transcriptional regulator